MGRRELKCAMYMGQFSSLSIIIMYCNHVPIKAKRRKEKFEINKLKREDEILNEQNKSIRGDPIYKVSVLLHE